MSSMRARSFSVSGGVAAAARFSASLSALLVRKTTERPLVRCRLHLMSTCALLSPSRAAISTTGGCASRESLPSGDPRGEYPCIKILCASQYCRRGRSQYSAWNSTWFTAGGTRACATRSSKCFWQKLLTPICRARPSACASSSARQLARRFSRFFGDDVLVFADPGQCIKYRST